jgi:hypothetical protein
MTVWIASYPRSGNSFCRTILRSLFQTESRSIYSLRRQALEQGRPPPPGETASGDDDAGGITYLKTHELPDEVPDHPALYVVRDGRDSYVSYAHFALAHFPEQHRGLSYAEVLRMLVESRTHFGGWSVHVEQWLQRPAQTAILRYEDMIRDPAGALTSACAGIGITLPEPRGTMPAFEELHARKPLLARKGRVGSWREEMPAAIEELFWMRHGPAMERLGYAR